jgi:deoxycytidylate deaminase
LFGAANNIELTVMIRDPDPFKHMQAAVDIVGSSAHPTNKIAATLACTDGTTLSRTNSWPQIIAERLGMEIDIGNASGTVHAETACVLASNAKTEGASVFVTDPPCPNCLKNVAEAGIKALYIDHKGFDKDFARRRGEQFEAMSLRVAERAGIAVHVVYRKDQRLETILKILPGYQPVNELPLRLAAATDDFTDAIKSETQHFQNQPFALVRVQNDKGQIFDLSGSAHPTLGYSHTTLESPDGKYNFVLEPLNRVLMGAARQGLSIDPQYVYSSRVPTAREFINMVGKNLLQLRIGNLNAARDIFGPMALKQLTRAKIITVIEDGRNP